MCEHAWRPLPDDSHADVRVEQVGQSHDSRLSLLRGCARSAMNSGVKCSRLPSNASQQCFSGINTTELPTFFMNTSSPSKRKALGRRTAWLWPFLNNFAVFM